MWTARRELSEPTPVPFNPELAVIRSALGVCVFAVAAFAQDGAQPSSRPLAGKAIRLASGTIDTTARPSLDLRRVTTRAGERVLLQFPAPLTPRQKDDLAAAGVSLLNYMGDGAYTARVPRAGTQVPHADWAGTIDPALRVAADFARADFATPERRQLKAQGLVPSVITLFPDASPEETADVLALLRGAPGATVHSSETIAGALSITATIPAASSAALAALPAVQFVENAPEITERSIASRWVCQSNSTNVFPLNAAGLIGLGQVIGVADSRPDLNHCAFYDTNPVGPTHRKVLAYNTTILTPAAHGTHVAAIALGDSGVDDENRGGAYGAKMVYSPTPAFNYESATAVFNLHHSQGARIHTNSWGNDATTQYDSLSRAVDDFMHKNEDDLIVHAVSNGAAVTNPENAKNSLAVGATQNAPAQASFCFGGVGPTADGRRKPEVFAPGCSVQSAAVGSPVEECRAVANSGTSMATPAVSAVATLFREYYQRGFYPSGVETPADALTPSGALLRATIVNSAQDMTSYAGTIPNLSEGFGRIDADEVAYFGSGSRRLLVRDVRNSAGLSTGGAVELPVVVNSATQSLRVTIAWTEPPAPAGAAAPVINNLDLEVVAPDNTLYRGNVFASGFSVPGGIADTLNNLEQVWVAAPPPGVWTFRVKGTAVNQGLQGFALAANADLTVPPQPLAISLITPPLSLMPADTNQQFTVAINPGDDTLASVPSLAWRRSPLDAYSFSPLWSLGNGLYRATLPRFACTDAPQFYVQAAGTSTGLVTLPANAPASTPLTATLGVLTDTELLAEGFDSGLPATWSTTGLWHATASCPQASPCEAAPFVYFGNDATCWYAVGAIRQQGDLTLPSLALPSLQPGESLFISYCSFVQREQFNGFDVPRLFVGAGAADSPLANSTAWETRTVDISAFAAQSPVIRFNFDTVDGFSNNFLGWQVDRVRVVHRALGCATPAPCVADLTGDRAVTTPDLTAFLGQFGLNVEAFSPGDFNGDGIVDTADLVILLANFGMACP